MAKSVPGTAFKRDLNENFHKLAAGCVRHLTTPVTAASAIYHLNIRSMAKNMEFPAPESDSSTLLSFPRSSPLLKRVFYLFFTRPTPRAIPPANSPRRSRGTVGFRFCTEIVPLSVWRLNPRVGQGGGCFSTLFVELKRRRENFVHSL